MEDARIAEVLRFWFDELEPEQYWRRDPELDRRIVERFGTLYEEAAAGRLDNWADSPDGALALVIALDQFPRNMFRDDPRAWASDGKALATAQAALARGFDREFPDERRLFLYMPFMHAEELAAQERCVALFATLSVDRAAYDAAMRHREIVARFGRFPHRNAVLGRETTPEEVAFLTEPNSSF